MFNKFVQETFSFESLELSLLPRTNPKIMHKHFASKILFGDSPTINLKLLAKNSLTTCLYEKKMNATNLNLNWFFNKW